MATPTYVQGVYSGMDIFGLTTFTITFPNPSLANNLLVTGFQLNSAGTVTSVKDNNGTSWTAGPNQTNTTYSQSAYMYYLANAPAGTTYVQVTVSGLTALSCRVQGWFQEWYNVATSSPVDASTTAIATPSQSAGSFTPSSAGSSTPDLILEWGMALSTSGTVGGGFNGTSITAGSGFTLLSADLQVGSCVQYQNVTSNSAINPSFTSSGAATWGSMAVAFKSAAAGTAPSSTAIRVVSAQHILLCSHLQSRTTPLVLQFPCQGNLLVGVYDNGDTVSIESVTDGASNKWFCPTGLLAQANSETAQIVFAGNATTSSTLGSITVTLTGTTTTDDMFVLYDVANAATAPLANAATAAGNQTTVGNLSSITITPCTSNGLIFGKLSQEYETVNGVVGTGLIFDSVVNAYDDNARSGGTQASPLDEDGGTAHIYNSSTSAVTFEWTYKNSADSGAVGLWVSVAAAFNASGQTGSVPVVLQGPINGVATSGTTCTATFPVNTTTGNTLLGISLAYDATLRTVSGMAVSAGAASFSKIGSQVGSAGNYGTIEAWAAANITGGTTPTITATYSGADTDVDLLIYELMNVPTSVTTDGTAAGKAGTASGTPTTPSITTTNPNDIIFATFFPAANITVGESGWTSLITTHNEGMVEYEGVTATQSALVASATQDGSNVYGSFIFALQGLGSHSSSLPSYITNPAILYP